MNLTIPDIPAGWFASPREIARALLDRHNAHLQSVHLRQALSEYVDDVTTLFSDAIVHSQTEKLRMVGTLNESPSEQLQGLL